MAVKPAEGFWELWAVYKRLTADREEVLRFARFREWEGRLSAG